MKAIFEKNDCPLTKAFAPPQMTKKTKRISSGILKAVYDSLPRDELRLLTDLCAYIPERVQARARARCAPLDVSYHLVDQVLRDLSWLQILLNFAFDICPATLSVDAVLVNIHLLAAIDRCEVVVLE